MKLNFNSASNTINFKISDITSDQDYDDIAILVQSNDVVRPIGRGIAGGYFKRQVEQMRPEGARYVQVEMRPDAHCGFEINFYNSSPPY